MSRKKRTVYICLILVVALLASVVNSSFGKYTGIYSGEAFDIGFNGSIYTIQLRPGGFIYEGSTNSVFKTVEYGAPYDWGEAPHTAIPATWNVDTIKADQVFAGWNFRTWGQFNAPTGIYERFRNPAKDEEAFLAGNGDDHFSAKSSDYFCTPEFDVNTLGSTAYRCTSEKIDNKYLKLVYSGSSNQAPTTSFTFSNVVVPGSNRYFIVTYRYTRDDAFLASSNPLFRVYYATSGGWAYDIGGSGTQAPPRNTDINSAIFYVPNNSTSADFHIRFDWLLGSDTSMVGETMHIYALAFADNEPQAKSIAQGLQEKFRSYKENNLLD